jgi:hypothetical protein
MKSGFSPSFYWMLLLFFVHPATYAQTSSGDSRFEQASARAVQFYHQSLAPENGLYNGGEYVDYTPTLTGGYPYFGPDRAQPGWVVYDGMRYDNLQLWYDLVKDAVVLLNPDRRFKIQLINERVQAFSLSGHLLVRLTRDSTNRIRTGFYELLLKGNVSLLKKSYKNLEESATPQGVERIISSDSVYYLEKGGRFLPVGNRNSLLEALADKKKMIKTYMRKNKLSMERSDETLLKTVAYYNSLTL